MQTETIPKIGFGTWKIGGESTADPSQDAWSLAAIRSALDLGYTHFDTAEMYASGRSEVMVGRAIRAAGVDRAGLFITSKVLPSNLSYEGTLRACEASLRRLEMDYLDLYLIHWPVAGMKLEEGFRALNQLVAEGKVRHLGVSNFDLPLMQRAQAQVVGASVPLSEMFGYSTTLRSLSQGRAVYTMQFSHYAKVPQSKAEEIAAGR